MSEMSDPKPPIPVAAFVNAAFVANRHHEFYVELFQNGVLITRVVMTPSHFDNLLAAMTNERAKWAEHVAECGKQKALDS